MAGARWHLTRAQRVGILLAAFLAAFALVGPWLTATRPEQQFADFVYAPPMPVHVIDGSGRIRLPFVLPLKLEDRLSHRFSEDAHHPASLQVLQRGALLSIDPDSPSPWFPLGTDAL